MNKKILVVDDEKEITEILIEVLSELGTIKNAFNGKEALELMRREHFDLVISDVKMPILSGLEFFEQAKKIDQNIPFIFISAFTDTNNVRKAWQLSAYDFLDKPINFELLKASVNKALELESSSKSILLTIPLNAKVHQTLLINAKNEGLSLEQWALKKLLD
jgi:two-component system response regulator AtoC